MVYVDELRPVGKRWLRTAAGMVAARACHLVADTEAELHAFAAGIGCKREWFQTGRHPHYDLTAGRREAAVRAGAVELTSRELVRRFQPAESPDA